MSLSDLCILLLLTLAISIISEISANSVDGCGGFVEESSTLIKTRKSSDPKLDYSQIMVELQTIDGLVKDRTQCAPNGYYFIPVYDMGSYVVKVKGPDGWLWNPENFPVTVDQMGCNLNADINFQLTGFGCFKYLDAELNSLSCNSRFLISGKVEGIIGGDSCTMKGGGPSGVKVDLLSSFGDIVSSVLTSKGGIYSFTSIAPGLN
ncbi:hypothetical protein ZOSMA_12G00380 [Zostera marina]|uniref:Nodal modulator 1 n=1 Tax=Zostera marina TaxID=29655 RepID=A0A0K9PZJ6_ZOSMR|nr:hypothetical protein ZOSMA_12G00380 [Zostera marina]